MLSSTRRALKVCALISTVGAGACRFHGVEDLVEPAATTGAVGPAPEMRQLTGPSCVAPATSAGHVLFRLSVNQHLYRIEARAGATPEDLSLRLGAFGAGADAFVSGSANGNWLLVGTSRLGCGDQGCLAVVSSDLCAAQVVFSKGQPLSADGVSVIGSDGSLVVFPRGGGAHPRDLYAVRRQQGVWGAPVALTTASPFPYHQQPYLSADGTKVTMDCGPDPTSGAGTNICEATTDGLEFRVTARANAAPPGIATAPAGNLVQKSAYEPNGGVVFDAAYAGAEQIWRIAPGTTTPVLVNQERRANGIGYVYSSDNAPCVLPDGRVVSLWLGRQATATDPQARGHELKMMNADGSGNEMLLIDQDVSDIGIFCTR